MKKIAILAVFMVALLNSCSAVKTDSSKEIYANTWELEYISGTRIAFEGLFPDKKPELHFMEADKIVHGSTSCNGYRASYKLDGNSITIGEPGAMTMRYCEGGGEQAFLAMMKKVNKISIDKDGKLNLSLNEVPMMRFKKVTKE
ncbi:META domain-containing protein [Flavobacterium suncheonense]|uniref:META domain-containing protein n=1 Tax=Flavobacterium suncheonense TaxID=350894 RepID=UPI003FA372E9